MNKTRIDTNADRKFNYFLINSSGTRAVRIDEDGRKEQLTLTTISGKLVTRTIQFEQLDGERIRFKITYKGESMFVFSDTILED